MSTSDLLGTKMLLATDGSEEAELATRAAIELAEGTASELHVVYVEPLPDFMKNSDGAPGYDRELYEVIEERARETLRKLNWRVKVAAPCALKCFALCASLGVYQSAICGRAISIPAAAPSSSRVVPRARSCCPRPWSYAPAPAPLPPPVRTPPRRPARVTSGAFW